MRRIAHISDLHFGRDVPELVAGVLADIRAIRPDVLVVSGDLTQRARSQEFIAARAFLDELPMPRVVVPGNHDLPLFDVLRRMLAPRERFRRLVGSDDAPFYADREVAILGLDTTDPLRWKDGEVSRAQARLVREAFAKVGPETFRVVVTHHPFLPPSGDPSPAIVHGARRALAAVEECGVDLLLAGHLHVAYTRDVRTHHVKVKRSILVAQAGTAVSSRGRGEPNAYNLVTLDPVSARIRIEVRAWDGAGFARMAVSEHARRDDITRGTPSPP